jgi:hypothetical protein
MVKPLFQSEGPAAPGAGRPAGAFEKTAIGFVRMRPANMAIAFGPPGQVVQAPTNKSFCFFFQKEAFLCSFFENKEPKNFPDYPLSSANLPER